ncbi:nucleoside/nucleotide kinase family protein [Paracoccus bogoriensis]|uniref:nucleoside/nucleotide kinase family protein n=1 Tax=Paracoccus bogoriensis TaxID=242065 RepID=UPI001FEC9EEB|nr:nucleoside/nucleotide kinase family protein [Paracoccus bogoriensis]
MNPTPAPSMRGRAAISRTRLAERLAPLAAGPSRRFVALAGPPGAGKSTLAEALLADLSRTHPGRVAILPMDGFHYDDLWLEPQGLRPRKGAPFTFDVRGLAATLARLRADDGPVAVPVFDRAIEIARAGARIIDPAIRLVLVEGNYLILDDPEWHPLAAHFDLTVALDVPLSELERRLLRRWHHLPEAEARQKVDANDLPNARLVVSSSRMADLVVKGED